MILVTGGTGMLGAHLLLELARSGENLRALKRQHSNIQIVKKIFGYYASDAENLFAKIEWFDGDILDFDDVFNAMEGVEYVYHAAAIVSFQPSEKRRMIEQNIKGTANVVNAALERKIKKLCHVSSISALGTAENGDAVDENSDRKAWKNYSGYSISKFDSELEVWRGITEGLTAVIVNPSVILGAGDWTKGSPSIIGKMKNGSKYYTSGRTGYVDVKDVVKIMVQLMQSDIANERFVVSSENVSYKDLLDSISLALSKETPSKLASPAMLNFAWRIAKLWSLISFSKPLLTKELSKTLGKQTDYSNKKILKTLNHQFIPIKESIKQICEIYLKDTKN